MKMSFKRWPVALLMTVLLAPVTSSWADTVFAISYRDHGWHHGRVRHDRWSGCPPRHHWGPPVVWVPRPIVIERPYVYRAVLTQASPSEVSDLDAKLFRLRGILQNQYRNGTISQADYDRYTDQLEAIEHDQREQTFHHGGVLTSTELSDLFRRIEQIDRDMEYALAR